MLDRSSGQVLISGDNGGVIVTGTVKGDVIIYGQQQIPVALHRPQITHPSSDNPAAMLSWQSRIPETVFGRDKEMEQLQQWVNSPAPLRIKLIYGEGGVGKTRLAFELADQLAAQSGWLAGQVRKMSELKSIPLGENGTLLIIDYPEQQTEAIKGFCESLKGMDEPEGFKLRILLLARRENADELADALSTRRDIPMALKPLNQNGWDVFQGAWQKIAKLKAAQASTLPLNQTDFEQWQAGDKLHTRPLFIIAFALHLSECPRDTGLQGPAIIKELVDRERQRLKRETEKLNKSRTEMGQKPLQFEALKLLFALAGIVGQLNKTAIEALRTINCDDIQIPSPRELDQTSLWREGGIPALQPDLLAAQLLNDELSSEFISPGPWLLECLTFSGEPAQIAECVSRLGRLRFDYTFLVANGEKLPVEQMMAQNQLSNSPVSRDPLIGALSTAATGNFERCQQFELALLRTHLELPLYLFAAAVYKTLEANTTDNIEKAHYLNSLSIHLAKSGDHTGGLDASRRAVMIYEGLTSESMASSECNAYLAMSLINLSNRLVESGDRLGALEVVQQAVDIYRVLASENMMAYGANLARSLNNLSICLAEKGNCIDEILKAIRLTVKIYEILASENIKVYDAELATSLHNLSVSLAESGDRTGGLKAIRRAVKIRDVLASENMAAYGADLASSLNNLSSDLAENDEHVDALKAILRSVEIREALASGNMLSYGAVLAMSLHNLSLRLVDSDDRAGALEVILRAVSIMKPFAVPGTIDADRFEIMKQRLAQLESDEF